MLSGLALLLGAARRAPNTGCTGTVEAEATTAGALGESGTQTGVAFPDHSTKAASKKIAPKLTPSK
jgi:hypothetical protein